MILLAIDPGPEFCGLVLLKTSGSEPMILLSGERLVSEVLSTPKPEYVRPDAFVCEAITPQKPKNSIIGNETIETCYVIGGIREWCRREGIPFHLVPRVDVKTRLLGIGKGTDAVIIQELARRGWKKGTKRKPGRAYGVKGHAWQALALAIAWLEMQSVP